MRVVVQRVTRASVTVAGEVVGSIDGPGLCLLVGATHDDTQADVDRLADKVWGLRIMRDELSAADLDAPVLVVSQFTLYADVRKGRRPSWYEAAPGAVSEPLVDAFVAALRARGATGGDRTVRRRHGRGPRERRAGDHPPRQRHLVTLNLPAPSPPLDWGRPPRRSEGGAADGPGPRGQPTRAPRVG